MQLIYGFQSTTVWKAFILNAAATSIAVSVALIIKMKYDRYIDDSGREIKEITSTTGVFMTFAITFIATFLAYTALHFIFGYGGGQLVNISNN